MQRVIAIFGILSIVLFSSAVSNSNAGFIDFNPVFDRFSKVKMALMPGAYLVKQQYVVVDSSGNEFGANNENYFSTVYHIGARLGNEIILPKNFNKPGEIDSAFQSYRATYTTNISQVQYRLAADTTAFTDVKLNTYNAVTPSIPTAAGQGFLKYDYKNVTEGKLLLFYADKLNELNHVAAFPYVYEVTDLTWSNGKSNIKDVRYKDMEVVGGMFFYEDVSFGAIQYKLVGFYENIGGDWQIVALENVAQPTPPTQLNPIGGKGKR